MLPAGCSIHQYRGKRNRSRLLTHATWSPLALDLVCQSHIVIVLVHVVSETSSAREKILNELRNTVSL